MDRILIIDDDIHIGNMLEGVLLKNGYLTARAYSGTEALLLLERDSFSLILLDLMLPGVSGEELLAKISATPTIVLSAKSDTATKVFVLSNGAVDYMSKPFDIDELLARIRLALKKTAGSENTRILRFKDIELDTDTHTVTIEESSAHLTRTEYAILKLLMQSGEQVLGKLSILDRISFDTPDCTESSLKQHLSNLRRKLRDLDGCDHIESVWGIGVRLC